MHELTRLDSGVTIVTEHMSSVRSVTLGMWLAVGSRDERPAEAGCSHFLEHLLFKGTRSRSAREIAEALDAVGGELNAFTSKEHTCFLARVLDDDVDLAFDVLADMIVDARNDGRDVEAERDVVLSELEIHFDTPDDLVHSDFARTLLAGHPLAGETLGSVESVAALDRETIHRYYLDNYRPGSLVVAAAGHVDHDRVVELAQSLLGDLGRPGEAHLDRARPQATSGVSLRQRPTEQAHVVIGVPGLARTDPERWALRVLDVLLGGGMSSRLFQLIREERGLAYNTFSYASAYSDGGSFAAYAGTSPGKVDDVLGLLCETFAATPADVTSAEVERAKGTLVGATVLSLEDTSSRMTRLGRQVCAGEPIVTVDEALRRIEEVDLDAVRSVARRLLDQRRSLAVVGPFAPEERDRFTWAVESGA